MTFVQELWDNKMTNTTAAALSSTPLWLTTLQGASEVAAIFLPILGVAWFAIQIYYHVKNKGRK